MCLDLNGRRAICLEPDGKRTPRGNEMADQPRQDDTASGGPILSSDPAGTAGPLMATSDTPEVNPLNASLARDRRRATDLDREPDPRREALRRARQVPYRGGPPLTADVALGFREVILEIIRAVDPQIPDEDPPTRESFLNWFLHTAADNSPLSLPLWDVPVLQRMVAEVSEPGNSEAVIYVSHPDAEAILELTPGRGSRSLARLVVRLLSELTAPSGRPAGQWSVKAYLHLPTRVTPPDASSLPVSIYLASEDGHEQVQAAIEVWLTSAGLIVEEREQPILGSWFQRLRVGVNEAVQSGMAQDVALTAIHAVDTRAVLYHDAQTTNLFLHGLAPVITALGTTKDAVIRAGALLIVKVDWQLHVFQLTAAQQAILDHRPQLATKPHEIVAELELLSTAANPPSAPSG